MLKHKKVIKVIKADKPKLGMIWFYPGMRRMMLVPWKYKIPDLKFLKDGNAENT